MLDLTSSQITKAAIAMLNAKGYYVWRQNQIRVPGRAFIGEMGLSDVIGFCKTTGKAVFCEVKTLSDKFSPYQITFLNRALKNGCLVFISTESNNKVILKEYESQ